MSEKKVVTVLSIDGGGIRGSFPLLSSPKSKDSQRSKLGTR